MFRLILISALLLQSQIIDAQTKPGDNLKIRHETLPQRSNGGKNSIGNLVFTTQFPGTSCSRQLSNVPTSPNNIKSDQTPSPHVISYLSHSHLKPTQPTLNIVPSLDVGLINIPGANNVQNAVNISEQKGITGVSLHEPSHLTPDSVPSTVLSTINSQEGINPQNIVNIYDRKEVPNINIQHTSQLTSNLVPSFILGSINTQEPHSLEKIVKLQDQKVGASPSPQQLFQPMSYLRPSLISDSMEFPEPSNAPKIVIHEQKVPSLLSQSTADKMVLGTIQLSENSNSQKNSNAADQKEVFSLNLNQLLQSTSHSGPSLILAPMSFSETSPPRGAYNIQDQRGSSNPNQLLQPPSLISSPTSYPETINVPKIVNIREKNAISSIGLSQTPNFASSVTLSPKNYADISNTQINSNIFDQKEVSGLNLAQPLQQIANFVPSLFLGPIKLKDNGTPQKLIGNPDHNGVPRIKFNLGLDNFQETYNQNPVNIEGQNRISSFNLHQPLYATSNSIPPLVLGAVKLKETDFPQKFASFPDYNGAPNMKFTTAPAADVTSIIKPATVTNVPLSLADNKRYVIAPDILTPPQSPLSSSKAPYFSSHLPVELDNLLSKHEFNPSVIENLLKTPSTFPNYVILSDLPFKIQYTQREEPKSPTWNSLLPIVLNLIKERKTHSCCCCKCHDGSHEPDTCTNYARQRRYEVSENYIDSDKDSSEDDLKYGDDENASYETDDYAYDSEEY